MVELNKEIERRKNMIASIGAALDGQLALLVCPPGKKEQTITEIDQILGPIPFPENLVVMDGGE